ncbi:pilus assembly protein PilM [Chloroflexota bacterium]
MITLELSSTSIKLMKTEGGRVTNWANLPLEPGVLYEEVVSAPQALGTAVKQLMASSGIKGSNITASVSGLYSLSRIIMVPTPLGERITNQAVREVAGEVMPLPEEELYLSWQTIGAGEGGQQVLVVGVPRDVIDSEMRALRIAGINPRILDLKALALARAVNREQALILNIEHTSFDTVLVINGAAGVIRTTAWQPGDLSVEDKAEHLAIALELTVGFHNSHNPRLPLDPATPLFITGQMSEELALIENLQARVGYPVKPLTPPLEYPADLPVSQYAVNIGLALKGTAASKNEGGAYSLPDINLLPESYQPWKPSAKQIYITCAIVAAIAFLFPLYQATSDAMAETATLTTRYDLINSALEQRKADIRKLDPLKDAITQYNNIIAMGGGFTEHLMVINSTAEELGIVVQSIAHEGGSITVNCQADSYINFRNYLTALRESDRFSSVSRPPERYGYVTGGTITLVPKPGE